jgi:hypothetical protein
VDHSIHKIRRQCTVTLRLLEESAFAAVPIRAIREAGRRFDDEADIEFRFFGPGLQPNSHHLGPGFFMALGAFRAAVGHQIALLAAYYDLDIESDLADMLPRLQEDEAHRPNATG